MIYHMMPRALWQDLPADGLYHADTLESEGFIHCTGENELLVTVANRFYRSEPGPFVILAIDEKNVRAEIRWEAADGHIFPHIYGAMNVDAVTSAIDFPRDADGTFMPLPEWNHSA